MVQEIKAKSLIPKAQSEAVGSGFEMSLLLRAQEKTWELVAELKNLIKVGTKEKDTVKMCDDLFASHGILKKWHKNRIRFGSNTLTAFREECDSEYVLAKDDIYFIDIGPVVEGYEGDAGQTFVLGDDPEKLACAKAAEELFLKCEKQCFEAKMSGHRLYEWAQVQARELGWELNMKSLGHRVADFPHALHHKGTLAEADFEPSEGLWVLEIQTRHPQKEYGAFFEDILRKDRVSTC